MGRTRECAEELHRHRCQRSARAQGGGADGPARAAHALELPRGGGRCDGRGLSDAPARAEARRLRTVRHLPPGGAALDRLLSTVPAPWSRGVHQLWFVDGAYLHLSAGAPDFRPRNQLDDQFYRIFDVRNPSRPEEVGRWWLPGTREGDAEPPPTRHPPGADCGFRAHNTNVYPERPDRCYLGYIDAGMIILDISDKANPKPICRWDNSPPYKGFTHTVLPLFERDLLYRLRREREWMAQPDWPKLVWILDAREETNPVPIATCPMPPVRDFAGRGGRFGAHNLHENPSKPGAWKSEQIILGTFFNGGLRAFDISDPYQPVEVGHFVPEAPRNSPVGAVQLNDVFVEDRGIVHTVDRLSGRALRHSRWSSEGARGDGAAGRPAQPSFRLAPAPALRAPLCLSWRRAHAGDPRSPASSAPARPRCCRRCCARPQGRRRPSLSTTWRNWASIARCWHPSPLLRRRLPATAACAARSAAGWRRRCACCMPIVSGGAAAFPPRGGGGLRRRMIPSPCCRRSTTNVLWRDGSIWQRSSRWWMPRAGQRCRPFRKQPGSLPWPIAS